jgi:hypothetical protein
MSAYLYALKQNIYFLTFSYGCLFRGFLQKKSSANSKLQLKAWQSFLLVF